MKPDYSSIIGKRFIPKKRYPRILMKEVYPTRVFYDFPRALPWEKAPDIPLRVKFVEFTFIHEGRVEKERYTYYSFFTHFERSG